jgi:HSP20 family protein
MTLFEQFDSLCDWGHMRPFASDGFTRAFLPSADLVVGSDEVVVVMDMPGLTPHELEIELVGDVLTVRGERRYPLSKNPEDGSWYRLERGYGKFQRTLQVPKGLDPDQINASLADGVLTIRIPQPESRKPRRIEIAAGGSQAMIEAHEDEKEGIGETAQSSEEPALAGAAA